MREGELGGGLLLVWQVGEEDGRGGVACGADGEDVPIFVRTLLTAVLVLLDGGATAAA